MLNNSKILITGGTGSFGNEFVEIILKKYKREGWKLEKVSRIQQNGDSVETRDFKEYFLFKEIRRA